MIKGIFLTISLSISLAALALMIFGLSGTLQENYITGAVIGPSTVTNYAIVFFIVAFIISLIIINHLRKSFK